MQANPFEYEQATALAPEFVRDVFIEDHNFTRFIESNRNVFLIGERGSGKSMTLLYNSIAVQVLRSNDSRSQFPSYLGIYVPCNTPLFHKREHELVEDGSLASIISEHFMVLGIAFSIAKGLETLLRASLLEEKTLRDELDYVLGIELQSQLAPMAALEIFLQKQVRTSQMSLNMLRLEEFRTQAFTFSTLVQPLFSALRRVESLKDSHFLILIDDAHDLNEHQMKALNSWVAYRERSHFSFKVAVADSLKYTYQTASGGSILDGHDFLSIDLQRPFQSSASDFGRLAKDLVERRLSKVGINVSAEEFFPPNTSVEAELAAFERIVEEEAAVIYSNPNDVKKRRDHVYKYARVKYFRDRDSRANLPVYAGFDTLTHLSTGVIRNLLRPCYWMYDDVYSRLQVDEREGPINSVPAEVQSRVIKDQSEKLWKFVETSLQSSIADCSLEDARRVFRLFDNLANLFRERLLKARSEPRAVAFTISATGNQFGEKIAPLLTLARRAQILYFRGGPAKDEGRRETYYVPNRMLWPIRGLDVVGQHARVSLTAKDVWAAAEENRPFPFVELDVTQGVLFDDKL